MNRALRLTPLVAALLLGACSTLPSGPGVLVLPGTGKSFDEFKVNDAECRQYASAQIGGGTPNDTATDDVVKSAVLGTAVGVVAGAALGGRSGAAVGAGTGMVVGTVAGSGTGGYSGRSLQQRYDFSYQQCMYARGNKIPVSGRFESPRTAVTSAPQAPVYSAPPSPPRYAPPPPPGAGHPPPAAVQTLPPATVQAPAPLQR